VRLTTPFRFRVVATLTLVLAALGCANADTELTGPGGLRPSFDIASDSGAFAAGGDSSAVVVDSSAVAVDGTAVATDSSAVATDGSAVVQADSAVVAAPDGDGYDPRSGYVVAY